MTLIVAAVVLLLALSMGVELEAHMTPLPPQCRPSAPATQGRHSGIELEARLVALPHLYTVPPEAVIRWGSGKFHKTWSRKRQPSSFRERKDEAMGTNIATKSQREVPAPLSGINTPMLFATISAVGAQPELAKFDFTASDHWVQGGT